MKATEAGHRYLLRNLGSKGYQVLTFLKRSSAAVFYGHKEHRGTNTQEVIRALIDRCWFLNSVIPCMETQDAIYHLRMALFLFEVRALRRKTEQLNKEAGQHVDEVHLNAYRDGYRDVPFSEQNIEHRPVGDDGHILLSGAEQAQLDQYHRDLNR